MKRKPTPEESPALRLFRIVAEHEGECFGNARSKERRNGALWAAASIACEYGLRFHENDLVVIAKAGYQGGRYGWTPHEGFYTLACTGRSTAEDYGRAYGSNRSAAIAYEKLVGRKPFILDGRRMHIGRKFRVACSHQQQAKLGRVSLSERILKVTSFNDKAGTLTACSYVTEEERKSANEVRVEREIIVAAGELREPNLNVPEVNREQVYERITITHEILRVHHQIKREAEADRKVRAEDGLSRPLEIGEEVEAA